LAVRLDRGAGGASSMPSARLKMAEFAPMASAMKESR
jgi:hypothetical protein